MSDPTPRQQFERFIGAIEPGYRDLRYNLWIIRDKHHYWRGRINGKGTYTKKTNKNTESRVGKGEIGDLFDMVTAIDRPDSDGVTWIPACPYLYPTKKGFQGTRLIWAEFDSLSKEEQWQLIDELKGVGLIPRTIVDSGGKSLHLLFMVLEILQEEDIVYIQNKFVPLGADPAPARNVVNQMRVPGFYRASKKTWQTLEEVNYTAYTLADFEVKLKQIYEATGLVWQEREVYQAEREAQRTLYADYQPPDMGRFSGEDLLQVCVEALERVPARIAGQGTYEHWRPLAVAISNFVGLEQANELLSQHSPNYNFLPILRSSRGQFGFRSIIQSVRALSGEPNWNLPDWFTLKYPLKKQEPSSALGKVNAFCKQLAKRLARAIQRKAKVKAVLDTNPEHFLYWDGGSLPTREEMQGKTLLFDSARRAELYEAISRSPEWQLSLDLSGTGTGKSHSVGEIDPNACWLRKDETDDKAFRVIYAHPNYRNPSVASIEKKFTEDVSRHQGLKVNPDKRTSLGEPWRSPAWGEVNELLTPATCEHAQQFLDLYNKGQDTEGLCNGCRHKSYCAKDYGDGYGFKYLKMGALREQRLRSSLAGLSPEMLGYKTLLVVDEVGALDWKIERKVTAEDMAKLVMAAITKLLPEETQTLVPFLSHLSQIISQESFPNFGLQHVQILEKLGPLPENIDKLIYLAEKVEFATAPKTNELLNNPNTEVQNKFLSSLLKIWAGRQRGVFCTTKKNFFFSVPNERQIETIRAAGTVIFQDATMTTGQLGMVLRLPADSILAIKAKSDIPSNLTIKQLYGAGNFNNHRSPEAIAKSDKIRDIIKTYYPKVGFIEYKKYSQKGDLVHFVDGRGSNEFKDHDATLCFGIPMPSLSAVHNDYQLFTGDYFNLEKENETFQGYYSVRVEAEMLQESNRLRATLRPDQPLDHWIVTNQESRHFWEKQGLSFELIDAGTLDPELLGVKERTELLYIGAVQELLAQGQVKIQEVADKLGNGIAAVSLFAKRYLARNGKQGGWKDFVELVACAMGHCPQTPITEEEEEVTTALAESFQVAIKHRLIGSLSELGEFIQSMLKDYFSLFQSDPLILLGITISKLVPIDRGRILGFLIPVFQTG